MFHMPTLPELLVLLAIIFVLFGASRLPEAGKALGEGIRNFKKALSGEIEEEKKAKEIKAEELEKEEKKA
ncbi:MAG: twin-arginine translocase TatA/TatE family subunit [Hydrogenobacter sp.]|uniref:twin-arginine translocase TatA/TatE family subunit n=1 Tax=Hydrogenobacter thermophilus TaxID=940 RepID=UPI0030FB4983